LIDAKAAGHPRITDDQLASARRQKLAAAKDSSFSLDLGRCILHRPFFLMRSRQGAEGAMATTALRAEWVSRLRASQQGGSPPLAIGRAGSGLGQQRPNGHLRLLVSALAEWMMQNAALRIDSTCAGMRLRDRPRHCSSASLTLH
jgi:hypothetical protein